ncbi:hypothetical protein QWT69_13445 [Sporosarcina oncorhynchi]|uniref:Uncharacterized protein n=1 Tax=Sporosarcina oncorhynchi TaxID=3056444 RepID=A0ABZ0L3V2_9BACL|nr:hypothetical protein [Sporosarcina sp. T2O-4]WOV86867.1 hypothetical protein QWT69_13445 [Sporosarcina sp. T2O-4]
MHFEYKEMAKKNGKTVSVRDTWENALLEAEVKGDQVKLVTNVHNDKTTHFSMPVELFERMYRDLMDRQD